MNLAKSCRRLPALLLPVMALAAQSPTPVLVQNRCGTPGWHLPFGGIEHVDCDMNNTNPLATYAPTFVYRIPVVVHVIQSSTGQGNLTDAIVRSQITVMNEDFRALAGTPGAAGTDTMIEFYLATTDPAGNPTTGIRRYTNNTWFNDSGSYWATTAWNPQRYLNIYTNQASGNLGYVPDLPQGGSVLNTNADRVVVLWSAFGRPGAIGAPYDRGRSATHEVGHYLGLFHTFEGGCASVASCFQNGDRICDTNPESSPTGGCPVGRVSCSSTAPIRNYLDYSDDTCMNNFTPQQARRMRCTLQHYRPLLASQCPAAAATVRNAGTNLNIFTAAAPRIGQNFSGNVLLFGSGYQFAALFAFTGGANVPLGIGGDRLLVDLGSLQVFQTGFAGNGITAAFTFAIPNALSLCGLPLATQGFAFGGPPDFRATNAVDMLVGF